MSFSVSTLDDIPTLLSASLSTPLSVSLAIWVSISLRSYLSRWVLSDISDKWSTSWCASLSILLSVTLTTSDSGSITSALSDASFGFVAVLLFSAVSVAETLFSCPVCTFSGSLVLFCDVSSSFVLISWFTILTWYWPS